MIEVDAAGLIAALANRAGGETYRLTEDCAPPLIRHYFDKPVVIEAQGCTLTGFGVLKGGNISIVGGTLTARGGEDGAGQAGYAVYLSYARDVRIEGATFVRFNRGLVPNYSEDIVVRFCTFEMGQDGIIACGGARLEFSHNVFRQVSMRPTTCSFANAAPIAGLSQRDCVARGGKWLDGWHQDAIQVRNGIEGLIVLGNLVSGVQQGIGEMNAKTDAPLKNVLIDGNDVSVSGTHSITIAAGSDGVVTRNRVAQETGKRTVIRTPATVASFLNVGQRVGDPGQGARA